VTEKAPFIPPSPDSEPIPPAPWKVFQAPGFTRLFASQVVSSIGDWTGIVAILALAQDVSTNAVGFVMIARMLPGFILAPIGGALVDRWSRKVVMVACNFGRAGLLAVLPFWHDLFGLILVSFSLEVLTLLWSAAKDASVPNIVKDPEQLAAANSLGMVAGFGMLPIGALVFALLASVSSWLNGFEALDALRFEQASLAIWVNSLTFVAAAVLVSGLPLDNGSPPGPHDETTQASFSQTLRDVGDGMRFIRANPIVRGVMIGLAGGLLGGGSIVPLGVVFATEVLHADKSAYGFLTFALGIGAAVGVVTLLWLQRRLPRAKVFVWSVIVTGVAIGALAWLSTLGLAIVCVCLVGAGAGCAYVTGFTLLQESVTDEMRGRMFATLYTVVRVCLLLSLTISPFVASALGALVDWLLDGELSIGSATLSLPGVRLALTAGGLLTVMAGVAARRRMRKSHVEEASAA
jgi:dTMP kinase